MLENVYVIRDIIVLAGGQIKGRKKVQKIIYILQQLVDLFSKPYEFRWNYYGVYSDELASELNMAEAFGILRESDQEEYGYRTYIIEAVDSSNSNGLENNKQVQQLVKYLDAKESRVLEVLSSIMYFTNQGLDEQEVRKKLYAFKRHLEEFFEEAFNAYYEIMGRVNRIGQRDSCPINLH